MPNIQNFCETVGCGCLLTSYHVFNERRVVSAGTDDAFYFVTPHGYVPIEGTISAAGGQFERLEISLRLSVGSSGPAYHIDYSTSTGGEYEICVVSAPGSYSHPDSIFLP